MPGENSIWWYKPAVEISRWYAWADASVVFSGVQWATATSGLIKWPLAALPIISELLMLEACTADWGVFKLLLWELIKERTDLLACGARWYLHITVVDGSTDCHLQKKQLQFPIGWLMELSSSTSIQSFSVSWAFQFSVRSSVLLLYYIILSLFKLHFCILKCQYENSQIQG